MRILIILGTICMIRTLLNNDLIGFISSNIIVLYSTFILYETKPYLKNTFDKILLISWICISLYYIKEIIGS